MPPALFDLDLLVVLVQAVCSEVQALVLVTLMLGLFSELIVSGALGKKFLEYLVLHCDRNNLRPELIRSVFSNLRLVLLYDFTRETGRSMPGCCSVYNCQSRLLASLARSFLQQGAGDIFRRHNDSVVGF